MQRMIVVSLLAFGLGYAAHSYISIRGGLPPAISMPSAKSQATASENASNFTSKVLYKDGNFSPDRISIKKGNYLVIVNDSESLMWLVSNYTKLNTVRGYAYGEQVKIRAEETGTFEVSNKLDLKGKPMSLKVE